MRDLADLYNFRGYLVEAYHSLAVSTAQYSVQGAESPSGPVWSARRAGVVMTRKGGSYKSVKPPLQGSQALQPLYRAAVICLCLFRSPSFVSSAPANHPFHQSVPIFIMSIFTLPLCGRVEQETARRNEHVVAPAIRKPDFRAHGQAELSLSLDKLLSKLPTLELVWGDPFHAPRMSSPKNKCFSMRSLDITASKEQCRNGCLQDLDNLLGPSQVSNKFSQCLFPCHRAVQHGLFALTPVFCLRTVNSV